MIIKNIYSCNSTIETSCHGGKGAIKFSRILEKEFQTAISFFDYSVIPPGSSIGFHKHIDSEETYFILNGEGIMNVNGEEKIVKKGDVILNQIGGSHGLINSGIDNLEILVFEGKQ